MNRRAFKSLGKFPDFNCVALHSVVALHGLFNFQILLL